MYCTVAGKGKSKSIYLKETYRINSKKTSTKIVKKLGKYDELLEKFNGNEEKLLEWAKERAKIETSNKTKDEKIVSVNLSTEKIIEKNNKLSKNSGYLFIQDFCYKLKLQDIARKIKDKSKFKFNLENIMMDMIFARVISPSSRLSSYEFCKELLEEPKYELEDVYKSLSILGKYSTFIQSELYRNSNFVKPRNTTVCYYDCTNFFFEIEQTDNLRKYGKSKEHRPNPIVTMGLFMDGDGMPLLFDLYSGNQNEQTTLKPLEKKLLTDFELSQFIYCSDAGLGSTSNKKFNSKNERHYVITQSLKKLKEEYKDIVFNPINYKKLGENEFCNLDDEKDKTENYNSFFYKIFPINENKLNEKLIVTYSPKYKEYQRKIRAGQIERAKNMLTSEGKIKKTKKNPNDPARFITTTQSTKNGEIASNSTSFLDESIIFEEEKYDGFYAVVTDLDCDINEIIKINKNRWEIEECFRIMKTEFKARPVYVRREERIKAHFLVCFISLLILRLLEFKLDGKFTIDKIIKTLRNMYLTKVSNSNVYVPSYERNDLTDSLHQKFNFRTDYEVITSAKLRNIIKNTKK